MATESNTMTCPICGFRTDIEYEILLHMEEYHAEGTSPFVADPDLNVPRGRDGTPATEGDANSDEDAELFVDCPVDGCLEQISLVELEDHINFHGMEENEESAVNGDVAATAAAVAPNADNGREYHSPYSRPTPESGRERAQSPTNHDSTIDAWKKIFNRRQARKTKDSESRPADGKAPRKRLGRSELGKHAYENKMPDSLVSLLRKGKYTSSEGIIPVLAKLLEQNPSTEHAYLCDPAVQHISKLRGEGGFCGYRNIQMLSSYVVGARAQGTEQLRNKIPSIFRIQEYIENAWDMGINASGRIETGGVRGTRKYIGTPEAQAMFVALQIPCEVEGFKSPKHGEAEAALFESVQRYFEKGSSDTNDKVRCTNLPPIYFQHRGHSLTIVGLERRVSGSLKLLVFDPMFHDPDGVIRLVGRVGRHGDAKSDRNRIRHAINRSPDGMLRLYRRGNNYLKKYHEFELLRLKTNST
ncbi:peptidase family C78-domain-containing protein [Xylaria cf. heliscus]|nr:peptidase family C78-domain-containing protein [Xylaria cf. heliscus]